MNKLSLPSRYIIAFASLALIATYFLPVWFIYLIAPQYPEGLTMQIWLNKLSGEVEIINGLNHYIGMKHIKADMFPEFGFLIYIVGFFIVFGLVIALTGSRKLLMAFLALTIAGAVAAMVDFYKWGYDYGHNLDPTAPIQVPGLSYQPPLFGHKTLLNFDAYSYPDVGGWIVIGVGIVFFGVLFFEWRKSKKKRFAVATPAASTLALGCFALLALPSCSAKPEPFQLGKDACEDCKMTIMEPNFGGEILTKKGRVFKFDDVHCIVNYIKKGNVKQRDIAQTVFVDYDDHKNFVEDQSVYFVVSPKIKSPMNSHAAAFATKGKAAAMAAQNGGEIKSWNTEFNALQ